VSSAKHAGAGSRFRVASTSLAGVRSYSSGTDGRRPTGRFQKKGSAVHAGELTALDLYDFQKPTGEHWIPLTMVVDSVALKASLRDEPCATDVSPHTSASDIMRTIDAR
jgi:hypothetical protein